jgi:thiol:disulfide interchange protein DsbD
MRLNADRLTLVVLVSAGAALATARDATGQMAAPRRASVPHTVVELIVDRQPDATTRELWAGLRFELEQGWHVYWINPGDSGGPPAVLWQPSGGIRPGEFEWPAPERIPLGDLMNYGYTNEVTLPFRVRLASPVTGAAAAGLHGHFEWQICRDICIRGRAQLALPLPVGAEDASRIAAWRGQIEQARRRVPAPAPAAWRTHATATADGFVVTVRMDRAAGQGTFFPLEIGQIDDAAPQEARTAGRELVLRLRESRQPAAQPKVLRGVLALPSGEAYVIEAPVSAAAKPVGRTPG